MYVLRRTIASARFSAPIGGWINAIKIAEDVAAALPMMRPVWRFANNLIHRFALSVGPQAKKPVPDTDPGSKGVLRLRYATLSTKGLKKGTGR